MSDIKKLEKEVKDLKEKLQQKEKELANLKVFDVKKKLYKKYDEIMEQEEMEVIFKLLYGYFLLKEYKYDFYEKYINRVAEFLDLWPSDVLEEFSELIENYKFYEETCTDEEVMDLINFYVSNVETLEEDDIEEMIKVFN